MELCLLASSTKNYTLRLEISLFLPRFLSYKTHYVDLWCGSPVPQRQTVIVDTGSGVTAFPCSDCTDCGVTSNPSKSHHTDRLFIESCSNSFKATSCGQCMSWLASCGARWKRQDPDRCYLGMRYAEWSGWHAYEGKDVCYIGGLHTQAFGDGSTAHKQEEKNDQDLDPSTAVRLAAPLSFGCQTRISGLFKTQLADGIMGMDRGAASYWYQLYSQKTILRRAFALCFVRQTGHSKVGTSAGAMSLGGTDERLHSDVMLYSTLMGSGYYYVQIRHMYIQSADGSGAAGKVIQSVATPAGDLKSLNGQATMSLLDSGTTDTFLTSDLAPYFQKAFKKVFGKEYTTAIQPLTKEEVLSYPTFIFQLTGEAAFNKQVEDHVGGYVKRKAGDLDPEHPYDMLIYVPPTHYFEYAGKNKNGDTQYAGRFFFDASPGRGSVLGANFMMGHDVLFDMDHSRVGWAESDCDYTALLRFVDTSASTDNVSITSLEDNQCVADAMLDIHPPLCSRTWCPVTLMVLALSGCCYLCCCRRKRKRFGTSDAISAEEIEMQTPPSAMYHDDENDEDRRLSTNGGVSPSKPYRDEDEDAHAPQAYD